jgi:glycerol kinase
MATERGRRLLAIDAGTTGIRAMLVAEDGTVAARGYREFPQSFPQPGWVEHDPDDWWTALKAATEEALAVDGASMSDIPAIGITNQRETTIVWDRATLRPVHPAIVWQDRRTAPMCERLREEGWDERIRERTGLVIDPYFSATKIAWILEHVDGARDAAAAGRLAFGTVDSYLIARMTGGARHVTDRTNASRTMAFDINRLEWDGEILDRLGIPASMLPEVLPSVADFGVIEAGAYGGAAVPVRGVAGDQQSALFGQACSKPGATKNTYGTGSFVLMHTGERPVRSAAGLLATVAASAGASPEYALEGAVFVTGAAIQWLRDGLGLIEAAAEAGPLAASVPDSGGVVFVPALTGLGAPWWDPYARGTIVGLSRGTTRAHLVRATVEAIAHQSADVIDLMRAEAGLELAELRVDGGAAAMDLLLQFQADLLGVPVRRAMVHETTALGAAYLAGIGAGTWSGPEELQRLWRADRDFEPRPGTPGSTQAERDRWRRAVERSKGWAAPSEN